MVRKILILWLIPCVVLLACLLPHVSNATIYSYVDENGTLHLTNVPNDPRCRPLSNSKTHSRQRTVGNPADYESHIRAAASRYEVDPLLVKAVIKAESNFNCFAVSDKGAMGLMQLMPETVEDLKVRDPFDPAENIYGGTCYLRKLLDLFDGDLQLVLAAYNAGPNRVKEIGRVPRIAETKQYIKNVLANYKRYQAASSHSKKWVKVAYD